MRPVHTLNNAAPRSPRMRDGFPANKWLPLAEVAAAVAAGADFWPDRPGPRGRRQEREGAA